MRDFRDLHVWQKSKSLVVAVYRATDKYPAREGFGLVQQTRGAAVSIGANLAEGCGRRGAREFARFVDIALGSAYELSSHLEVAVALGFLDSKAAAELMTSLEEVRRMLVGLTKSLIRR
ncbi:MAG TPA: four helix bundle protein [Acidimicrobiia bacterium]|nr:four helix bundle protein [Acidimicrobiia bacterium]